MIVLLDTATPTCKLWLYDGEKQLLADEWLAERTLAEKLLGYIEAKLTEHGGSFEAITGIGFMRGPGSFTGLRIGASVLNAIASDRHVPIVGTTGESWRETALQRLAAGEDDKVVLPEYGREARITQPRK